MSLPSRSGKCFSGDEVTFNDEVYITNIRHKSALQEALSSLHLVGAEYRGWNAGGLLLD